MSKLGVRNLIFGDRSLDNGYWKGVEVGSRKCFLVPIPYYNHPSVKKIIKCKVEKEGTIFITCVSNLQESFTEEAFDHVILDKNSYLIYPNNKNIDLQRISRLWRDVLEGIYRNERSNCHFSGYFTEFGFKRLNKEVIERLQGVLRRTVMMQDGRVIYRGMYTYLGLTQQNQKAKTRKYFACFLNFHLHL